MKKTYLFTAVLSLLLAAAMTGCAGLPAAQTATTAVEADAAVSPAETADSITESDNSTAQADTEPEAAVVSLSETAGAEELFSSRDLTQTADIGQAQQLTVADNSTLDITAEGVYTVSGSAKNCTIRIEADETAKIQLVLDSVSVTNDDFPVIYFVSGDKLFVTTTDSTSSLSVTGAFRADGQTNTDAVIFAKQDLTLNGTGTLQVTSSDGNGITCKDDLKITGGTYEVTSALDAFEANDTISVSDGTFRIQSDKDGFHCENDTAEGTITIQGGTFDIQGGSDGMQACALLQIDGGQITVNAPEGLEATYVRINDGTINIQASDDGINASASSASYEPTIEINGGDITVEVGPGDTDGLDSNGAIYVNGGTINVTAQMSSFDYDTKAEFNGGTIIINGTEVSEIPQSMMGGGMQGGGMRGGMRGDFNGEMPPEGFDGQMPPEGFDGEMPSDFNGEFPNHNGKGDRGQMPPQDADTAVSTPAQA
ncbi:MAG: carbohydrate-binding domain-containing protein [Oscillospiraceae bacterium]|nr:carbohydrate-binding domain-containing protein [Oscillospiraceae bacterium]